MADLTETEVFEEELGGSGLLLGIYTATKVAQSDTVTLGNFETIHYADVQLTAGAVAENVSVATNVITLRSTGTGAILIKAIGTSVKSTGGAT